MGAQGQELCYNGGHEQKSQRSPHPKGSLGEGEGCLLGDCLRVSTNQESDWCSEAQS